jgi:hypothetical protein
MVAKEHFLVSPLFYRASNSRAKCRLINLTALGFLRQWDEPPASLAAELVWARSRLDENFRRMRGQMDGSPAVVDS